ncbi:MAG: hypothetical protein MJY59_05195 [Bacteroidaceae bacterium]|nr:hypothetical protein [Bacteroidaceae bacterium]
MANKKISGIFPSSITAFPRLEDIDLSGNNLSGDIGTAAYAFAQQNPGMMTSVRKVDISGNKLSGNIATFANSFPNLTTLDASGNCIEEVTPAISPSVTSLDLSRQTIARVTPLALTGMSAGSLVESLPTVLLYNHENQTYTTDIAMLCTTADSTWSMTLTSQDGELSIACTSEQNTYYGESGETLRVSLLNGDGSQEGSTFSIALTYDNGDGNFDGAVDILDLQSTILYCFDEYDRSRPFNFNAADTYKDSYSRINVQDVVSTVNLLLDNGSRVPKAGSPFAVTDDQAAECLVFVRGNQVILSSAEPVAALHVLADAPVQWDLGKYGLEVGVKRNGMVAYSLTDGVIPAGETVIGTCPDGTHIINATLSDRDAQRITEPYGGAATSISVSQSASADDETFDIDGRRKGMRSKGLNIVRQGSHYYKILK